MSEEKKEKKVQGLKHYFFAWRLSYSSKWLEIDKDLTIDSFKSDNLVEHLKERSGEIAKKFIFQLEMTKVKEGEEEHENWHYQGYWNLKERKRRSTLINELKDEFPGIEIRVASKNGIEKLKKYSMKEETRVKGPWGDAGFKYTKAYDPKKDEDLITVLRPWQQTLKDIILNDKPNNRKIMWVYDEKGGVGKSSFTKYMGVWYNIPDYDVSDKKDILAQVAEEMMRKAYIFDLSRTKSKKLSMDEVYSAIEQVKNGVVKNTKYKVKREYMNIPHVIVFSNYPYNKEKMSQDRWSLYKISADDRLVFCS